MSALGAAVAWDPAQYLKFAAERLPFLDLLGRVGPGPFARIVDLGCGEGRLTAELASRWPAAQVIGVDSSAEMIARARARQTAVQFICEDLRQASCSRGADLLLCNAVLHWLPDHLPLLERWIKELAPVQRPS